ncbi:hypothetical protein B0H19DRAFT_1259371 [Mycena capillaripes]|nr:hypothetical protein B0H19DRAFT_1259371 [Mycena capillaripes]
MPFQTLSPADAPILESIAIEGLFHRDDPEWMPFFGTTSLHTLICQRVTGISFFPPPGDRPRHLRIEPDVWYTAAEGLELLRRYPNLEICTIPLSSRPECVTHAHTSHGTPAAIVYLSGILVCLSLYIDRITSETIVECLRLIPALQELVLCYDSLIDSVFWTSLTPTDDALHSVLCPEL